MNVILATQPPRRPLPDDTVWLAFLPRWVCRGDRWIELTPQQFRIASYIIACPHPLGWREIAHWLWCDDPHGGALRDKDTIQTHLHFARRRLDPIGITLNAGYGGMGWRAALMPMPAVKMQEAA